MNKVSLNELHFGLNLLYFLQLRCAVQGPVSLKSHGCNKLCDIVIMFHFYWVLLHIAELITVVKSFLMQAEDFPAAIINYVA